MVNFLMVFFDLMFFFWYFYGCSMVVVLNYLIGISNSNLNILDKYQDDFNNSKTFEELEVALLSFSLWHESRE